MLTTGIGDKAGLPSIQKGLGDTRGLGGVSFSGDFKFMVKGFVQLLFSCRKEKKRRGEEKERERKQEKGRKWN